MSIEVIDETALRTTPYVIEMEGTPATTFTVRRNDGSNTPVYVSKPVNQSDLAVVDGFRVSVTTADRIGGVASVQDGSGRTVSGSANLSADSSWYVTYTENAQADTAARSYDYEIRFSTTTTVAYSWGVAGSTAKYTVPFSVWNTTTNTPVAFEIRDLNNNNQWEEGEAIYITRVPYPATPPAMGTANPATQIREFAYQVLINNAAVDTAKVPPVAGTVVRISSYNALTAADRVYVQLHAALLLEPREPI